MKTLTLEVEVYDRVDEPEFRMWLACQLYANQFATKGNCAKLAGLSYREFFENMGKYGASPFMHYTEEDLMQDLKNIEVRRKPDA